MKTPQQTFEARLFIRGKDGHSLIVPTMNLELEEQRLSYGISVPMTEPGHFDSLESALRESRHEDDHNALSGFMIQRFIGMRQRSDQSVVHGYLAQVTSSEATGALSNHQTLELSEAQAAIRNHVIGEPLRDDNREDTRIYRPLDRMDTMLGNGALTMIAATLNRVEDTISRDKAVRSAVGSAARFGKQLEVAYGNKPLTDQERDQLMREYDSHRKALAIAFSRLGIMTSGTS